MNFTVNLMGCRAIRIFLKIGFPGLILAFISPIALALAPSEPAAKPVVNGIDTLYTTTLFIPIIYAPIIILCDGQIYDGANKILFNLETEQDKNPNIKKIIRNCTFKNSNRPPIVINSAQNVLIEGNTFENIRTNIPGSGIHAINMRCDDNGSINNITIRNNSFKDIGADGIQLGANRRAIKNVFIENNIFVGSDTAGENGVDIKGVDGPVYVKNNRMHGFRPCESPTSNPPGNQDCSGATGAAMVIHQGASSGSANNVIVEGNHFYDSVYGLQINANPTNIIVRDNDIYDNISTGLWLMNASNVTVEDNRFANNPEDMIVHDCINCTIN